MPEAFLNFPAGRGTSGCGDAGHQPQFGCHAGAQRAGYRAHIKHVRWEAFDQVVQPDPGVEFSWPAAGIAIVIGTDARSIDAGHPLAGEAQRQPVDELAHVARLRPRLWLIFFHPQRLAWHPFGRDIAVAVDLTRRVVDLSDAIGLVCGAHVHPDDGRSQRAKGFVHHHHSAARAVGAQAND